MSNGSDGPNGRKRVALVAHDQMKDTMVEWAKSHKTALSKMELFGTGTTGGRIADEVSLSITCLTSAPLGLIEGFA